MMKKTTVYFEQKSTLLIALLFFLPAIYHCRGPNQEDQTYTKPNILFIMADDLGYGDLGCYGQDSIRTPNIDKLAAEGMRFTAHYAGSTVCAPSRCALLTGLHTGHAAIRANRPAEPMGQFPLPAESITIAELLSETGYRTAVIGKWGLGGPDTEGQPNRQGFDDFYGYLCQGHAHNYYPDFLFRNGDRIAVDNVMPEPADPRGMGVAVEKNTYSHDLFVKEALRYISEAGTDEPFFLYLPLTIPHANNQAGKAGMEVPDYGQYASKNWPDPQKGLAAMISRMDEGVGLIMKTLQEKGLDQNTVVFFTSDNGPHKEGGNDPSFFNSNGPFTGIKRDLYEGGIRVPLIVRWPGHVDPGSSTAHISAHWDFLPTACDMAGVDPPELSDGISYLPTLLGEEQPQHDYLYWEFHKQGGKQAVRMGPWKGVALQVLDPGQTTFSLYNLEEDPGEADDLAGQFPKMEALMQKIMKAAHYEDPNWPFIGLDAVMQRTGGTAPSDHGGD